MENNNINCLNNTLSSNRDYTPIQLILPLEIETIISFDDPIVTFDEIMKGCNLEKYMVSNRKDPRGSIGYNLITLLKVILFGFMINGYVSLRKLEKACINDIRFRWLLRNENKSPSHMTFSNFINNYLTNNIEDIFDEINRIIFERDHVDLNHIYIDGTKMEANANKYSWVWKNACLTSRNRLYTHITTLLDEINNASILLEAKRYDTREIYEIEYLESIVNDFTNRYKIDEVSFVYGKGKRKTQNQRFYELLTTYLNKLKEYAYKVETCGEKRNSYSKIDNDATFMRIKTDYMGNDQLLPAYNLQFGICDEYIAVADINQFASDMDCFIPLMLKYKKTYGCFPKYPIADAGYGSQNNYIFCEKNGMEKFMKFTMYKKETTDNKFHNDQFRPINFKRNNENELVCPNGKVFKYIGKNPVRGNKYGREQEMFECEDCSNCPFKKKCCKTDGNRKININQELDDMHQEVIDNLESVHGALLRMNRSIQSEGTFGIVKQDRNYKRIVRKGLKAVNCEIFMVSIGYNLMKFHYKKFRTDLCC
jgi:transposase